MENNTSINTQLNISNNDIVTMLLEERKELLNKEIHSLIAQQKEILEPYIGVIANKLTEFYTSDEFLFFKSKCYEFAKLYNPKIEIKIVIGNEETPEEQVRKFLSYYHSFDSRTFSPDCLVIQAVNDDDEDNIVMYDEGDGLIAYPAHLEKEFKLELSEDDKLSINTINNKISQYEIELRNSNGMKDKLVARMTKAAIMNNPDLLAIRDNVLKLE